MSDHWDRLKQILLSRLALNLYFWAGFLIIPPFLSMSNLGHGEEHYHSNFRAQALFALFYTVIIYTNNLLLLPRSFQRRQYIIYFILIASFISIWAYLQAKYDYLFYGCNCLLPLTGDRFAIAGFQISAFIIAFAAAKLVRDYLEKEDEYQKLDKIRLENELNFLRGQINPHFLFNTLNSLYAFALEKSDKVPEFILRLSEMMRYMLYECNEPYVTLDKEINYLKSYIELQKIRMEDRGTVKFSVSGDTADKSIAPFLLINFVENSFKHSQDNQIKDIIIDISLKVEQDEMHFRTINNTISKPGETSAGIGLKNVRKRLELLYYHRYELQINSTDTIFETKLTLRLIPDEHQVLNS